MTETVLVTGGTGFVGGWCIVELLRGGHAVRTTVRSLSKADAVRAAVASQVEPGDRLTFAVADLMQDAGWDAAAAGCGYVLHVASPMSSGDADDMIAAARDGAVRVLRAAVGAGVKRVVLTSSTAACAPRLDGPDSLSDETVWTDLSVPDLSAYRRSKTLAERAAWDFMAQSGGSTTLASVLPTAVFGPVLPIETLGSVQVIGRMLDGRVPGNPRRGFNVVDVRDLAVAHVLAMTAPEAAGQRFIASSDFMWLVDIAKTLKASLGARAGKVSTRTLPNLAVKLLARTNPAMREIAVGLGRKHGYSSEKARRVLGWTARPATETVVDCAESLLAATA